MTAEQRALVRLRWARGAFTSPLMPVDDARHLRDRLLREVIACGDGHGVVFMHGFDGREIDVRGRDVVAVEYVPEGAHEPRHPTPRSGGPVTPAAVTAGVYPGGGLTVTMGGAVPSDGTAFLREQAARHAQRSPR